MTPIEQRRRQRDSIARADEAIDETDKRMSAGGLRGIPPMLATPEQLAENPQQAITLNVEWVSAALNFTRAEGWSACIDVWQSLIDYANEHPEDWRDAFNEVVTDPALREILRDALDAI